MRLRIEAGNGIPSRFKIWDDETGQKIGLVQSAALNVDTKGSTLQITYFKPEEFKELGYNAPLYTSPVLKAAYHPPHDFTNGAQFVFKD